MSKNGERKEEIRIKFVINVCFKLQDAARMK